VRGNLARGTWEKRVKVPAVAAGEGSPAVTALYAREHVADLEMRWTIGREVEIIDRTIEKVGVAFQIATRKTSWVAIDEKRSVDPNARSRSEEMPHELPYGTSMASFGLGGGGGLSTRTGGYAMPMAQTMAGALGGPLASFGGMGFGGPPGGPPPSPPAPAPMQVQMHVEAGSFSVDDAVERKSRPVAPRSMATSQAPLAKRSARRWPLVLIVLLVLFLIALVAWFFAR